MRYLSSLAILTAVTFETQAYVGPGLGAGTIGVVLGLFVSVLLAIFAIFWYPIKRMLRKNRKTTSDTTPQDTEPDTTKN